MSQHVDQKCKTLARLAVSLLREGHTTVAVVDADPPLVLTDADETPAVFEAAVADELRAVDATRALVIGMIPEGFAFGVLVDLTAGIHPVRWLPDEDRLQFYDGKMEIKPTAPGWHLTQALVDDFGITAMDDDLPGPAGPGPFIGVTLDPTGTPKVLVGIDENTVRDACEERSGARYWIFGPEEGDPDLWPQVLPFELVDP